MATRSTASSGTDPRDPGAGSKAGEPPAAPASEATKPTTASTHDAARRAFFFQFGRQAASAAGQVAGMADLVGRTSSALAGELLGLDQPASAAATAQPAFVRTGVADPVVSAALPAAEDRFRSAYRLSDEGLVMLDQRRLPEALDEVVARRGSDVAYYLRLGVARGGPLMAQVAAYGLWLTALERADMPADQCRLELRRTAGALLEARPSSRPLARSVERMRGVLEALDPSVAGVDLGHALRAEADAIAAEVTASEAALAAALETTLAPPGGRPLTVLLHGGQGALVAGQLGAAIVALVRLREAGHVLRAFVTEGRPFMDGARLASWELRQAGIEHKVIADSAAAWLLAHEPLDAIVVRAEWIAANGDVGALVGARALAQLAAAARVGSEGPRMIVVAPAAAVDEGTPDGAAIPEELRPARDLAAYLSDTPIVTSGALVPAADVIPSALVGTVVTDQQPTP